MSGAIQLERATCSRCGATVLRLGSGSWRGERTADRRCNLAQVRYEKPPHEMHLA